MKLTKTVFTAAIALMAAGTVYAHGHDGFYGRVEQMPATGSAEQTWVIGGKTFTADQRTHIDSRRGTEIKVGTCVKVDGEISTVKATSSCLKLNKSVTAAARL